MPLPAPVTRATRLANRSLRIRHHLQLQQDALLLLFEILPALLHVNVVPGEDLGHRPIALRVPGDVDAEVGKGLPPDFGLETLTPAVEPAAAAPAFLERRRHAAIAARQDALQQAAF